MALKKRKILLHSQIVFYLAILIFNTIVAKKYVKVK